MATKWQRTSINIPKKFNKEQREKIAEKVIDWITKRTLSGKNEDNRKFVKYTKEYAKKKGVPRSSVDLVLNFEMLTNIQLLSERSGKIIVGFEKGSKENAKADGNIRGTYGQPKADPAKARPFLGIKESRVEKIYREVGRED